MNHTIWKTPSGEELVVMSKADYQALVDAADAASHAQTVADVAAGRQEWLGAEDVAAALAEPTPLAFWRKRRGLTQVALARAVGASQSYVAALEAGKRKGDPALFARLARALGVRIEDIVET